MSQQTTFGQRRTYVTPPAQDDMTLNTAVEAFRAEFAARGLDEVAAFGDWRRSQRNRRLVTGLISAALMCPGLICFVLNTSWVVSAGLELAGLAGGWWLRREQRRQLNEIATWETPAAVDGAATDPFSRTAS